MKILSNAIVFAVPESRSICTVKKGIYAIIKPQKTVPNYVVLIQADSLPCKN